MEQAPRKLNPQQHHAAIVAPLFVLRFLIDPSTRQSCRNANAEWTSLLSDSGIFYRLHDLFWTLRELQVVDLLSEHEKTALSDFNRAFDALPWRQVEGYPHIRELPNDDLSSLVPAGRRLFQLLEATAESCAKLAES